MMDKMAVTIHFSPLLPMFWLGLAIGVAVMALAFAFWKNRNGMVLRCLLTAAFIAALLNPSLIEEQRDPVKDVAFVVVDKSPSQDLGERKKRTEEALAYLGAELKDKPGIELRVIESSGDEKLARETRLFEALDKAIADVPPGRRAGAVFLTDGQIHDIPKNIEDASQYGPVTTWLSGEKNEKDRRLVIVQAPAYGIVGQSVQMKYKVEDTSNIREDMAAVTINRFGQPPEVVMVEPGEEQTVELKVEHAGQNVFELGVQGVDGELTPLNNRAALIVNGVRDRLRVLLVSGQPHAGGRTWRDLLTSDPGVDLVHFTILRDPEKLDLTPQNELSLIAFPFQELFETKLYDFDLIIFDQYKLNRILPDYYFENIVKYVEQGGALLEASGPSFATEDSVYYTDLANILPAAPTGDIIRKPFKPALTEDGFKHPVTSYLEGPRSDPAHPGWSNWLRQVGITRRSGDVLMKGANDMPLLILDRVGKGRVAQLASDHIWLWSRGYGTGGPHAELLRRIVHWSMKEPELDEKALTAEVHGDLITVRSRNFRQPDMRVQMTKPDGKMEEIKLESTPEGILRADIKAELLGIYSFEDADGQKAYAVSGDLNPPELSGVRTTEDLMKPLSDASGGGMAWMANTPRPNVRFYSDGRMFGGGNNIIFRRNNAYDVKGVEEKPVLPAPLLALALLMLVTFVWWREGRAG
jgi:hypothetical protein